MNNDPMGIEMLRKTKDVETADIQDENRRPKELRVTGESCTIKHTQTSQRLLIIESMS